MTRRWVHLVTVFVAVSHPAVVGAAELLFDDGLGGGDLWAWSSFVGGSTAVGDCPCEMMDRGDEFFVDPQLGSDTTGDGSQGQPWASLQHVIDERVACRDQYGVETNPGAPVEGGDVIVLVGAGGHDQDLSISGCYNLDWVTIRAAVRHQPVLRSVHFRGSGRWRLDGLRFANGGTGIMVRIEDHGTQGPARHLQVLNCRLSSGAMASIQDWVDHVSDGMRLSTSLGPLVARCNDLENVAMGFVVSGSGMDIIANRVEYFSRDGIATGGHRNRFVGNVIYDSVSLGDGHHDDFFQSHMGANPDVSSDVWIIGNQFMNRYGPEQTPGTFGPTQCLSGFEDGPKERLWIANNVCKADHWHGITWYDTNNSVIVNNTVVGGSNFPGLPPGSDSWPTRTWISIEGTGNTVRNNLTTRHLAGGDHNLEIVPGEEATIFVDWLGLDLHLATDSAAIDAGSPVGAPTHDRDGVARDATPDLGAYEAR
jgi:hypothetical protein